MTPKVTSLLPIVTEKSVALAKVDTYMFKVNKSATKGAVKEAVESRHDVKVEAVNTLVRNGKVRNSYRKGRRPIEGQRSDTRIAYVKVKSGETIKAFDDIIEGMEEA